MALCRVSELGGSLGYLTRSERGIGHFGASYYFKEKTMKELVYVVGMIALMGGWCYISTFVICVSTHGEPLAYYGVTAEEMQK